MICFYEPFFQVDFHVLFAVIGMSGRIEGKKGEVQYNVKGLEKHALLESELSQGRYEIQ